MLKNVITNCRICSANDFSNKFIVNLVPIIKCNNCSLVQIGIDLDAQDLEKIYAPSYFDRGKYIDDLSQKLEHDRRISILHNLGLTKTSNILDFGCADGGFIKASKMYFELWGTDLSSKAIDLARSRNPELTSRLEVDALNKCIYTENYFDAIVLWDVIEHINNPSMLLCELSKFLRNGGLLILSTPNYDSLSAKLFDKRWAFLTPPEHVCYYGNTTLDNLCIKLGFQKLSSKSLGKWVNLGFLLNKFSRIYPNYKFLNKLLISRNKVLSRIPVYVPTKDILYSQYKLIKH